MRVVWTCLILFDPIGVCQHLPCCCWNQPFLACGRTSRNSGYDKQSTLVARSAKFSTYNGVKGQVEYTAGPQARSLILISGNVSVLVVGSRAITNSFSAVRELHITVRYYFNIWTLAEDYSLVQHPLKQWIWKIGAFGDLAPKSYIPMCFSSVNIWFLVHWSSG